MTGRYRKWAALAGFVRQRISPRLGVACILLVASAIGFWYGQHTADSGPIADGGLEVASHALDFGEIWEQDAFEWRLPMRNATDMPIVVLDVKTTCLCAQATPTAFTVPPAGTQVVSLSFDLTRAGAAEEPAPWEEPVPVAVHVAAVLRGPRLAAQWRVSGTFRRFLYPSPKTVDFADELVVGQPFAPRAFRVVCSDVVADLTATAESSHISVVKTATSTERSTLGANRVCHDFEVQPRGDLDVSPLHCTIALVATAKDGARLPTRHLQVIGKVVPDARATPEFLTRAIEFGADLEETVVLSTRTGADLTVLDAVAEGEIRIDLNRPPVQPSSPSATLFRVVMRRPSPGLHTATLRFVVRPHTHSLADPITLMVPLRCQVLDPEGQSAGGGEYRGRE